MHIHDVIGSENWADGAVPPGLDATWKLANKKGNQHKYKHKYTNWNDYNFEFPLRRNTSITSLISLFLQQYIEWPQNRSRLT